MLYILKSNGHWEKTSMSISSEFQELYQKLNNIMVLSSTKLHYPKNFTTQNNNLQVEVVRVENKSQYDLIMIVQFNKLTNGLRFLVYARINYDVDPKILDSIDSSYLLQFCPYTKDIAHFV